MNSSSSFLSQLDEWLAPYWKTATPGLALEVYQKGEKTLEYQGGDSYRYYDLASLTKVLLTVPAMISMRAKGLWEAETRVCEVLDWWPHPKTKIVDLLTHSSGLLWWKPFYKELESLSGTAARWEHLKKTLRAASLNDTSKSVYSDLGFLSLAFILQKLSAQTLPVLWEQIKKEWAPQSTLHWISSNEGKDQDFQVSGGAPFSVVKAQYAPTEFCAWRGRRLQGEVHDENAWALGGLSTHAGLFGTPNDVASVFLMLREIARDKTSFLHSSVKTFMQRQKMKDQGDWALGFMMPTPGVSSSGQFFSENSLGHTGFTGTSVWWDVDKDIIIVLLSNRVYYGREQREFAKLRPLLHDKIMMFLNKHNQGG